MNQRRVTTAGAIEPGPQHTTNLERALRRELLSLSFHSLETCVGDLLRSLGYDRVRIRRRDRDGRNCDGGWDIEAMRPTGLTEIRTVVQVKQYADTPVQKRYVDELRGGMLRANADHGIIMTLSKFSGTASDAAAAGTIAPVRLIDGDELLRLMIAQGIGVRTSHVSTSTLDQSYFDRLQHASVREGSGEHAWRRHADAVKRGVKTSITVVVVTGGEKHPSRRKEEG